MDISDVNNIYREIVSKIAYHTAHREKGYKVVTGSGQVARSDEILRIRFGKIVVADVVFGNEDLLEDTADGKYKYGVTVQAEDKVLLCDYEMQLGTEMSLDFFYGMIEDLVD